MWLGYELARVDDMVVLLLAPVSSEPYSIRDGQALA
jgi:hypothetical protein